jgi:iron complex outermembrane receptor protein
MQIGRTRRLRADLRTSGARASRIALVLSGALCVAAPAVAADERVAPPAETEAAETEPTETEPTETERNPEGPPPGVEVMRVRGRGITSIVSEVPESVTRFDAATIEALGAQNVADLSRVTPNVNIVERGATQANFYVRGIGLADPSANSAGAVAVFQDGVALNAPAIQTGQLFDVQTVEVLRGPQGTGPFRNASAGA